jgi:hypothetical protein
VKPLDVDVLGRDASGNDGALRSVHPSRASADEHIVFGHVGHEMAERLNITDVFSVLW